MTNPQRVINQCTTFPLGLLGSRSRPLSLSSFFISSHSSIIFSTSDCLFGKRNRTTKWNLSESYLPSIYSGSDSVNVGSCGVREGVKAGYSKTTRHFVSPSQMHYLQDDVKKKVLGYNPN
jgi:hypothetical protein